MAKQEPSSPLNNFENMQRASENENGFLPAEDLPASSAAVRKWSYFHPHNIPESGNLPSSQDFQSSQYYQDSQFVRNPNQTPISEQVPTSQNIYRGLFGDVQHPNKNQKGAKNVAWCMKEDIALMSSWIFVNGDDMHGRYQKGFTIWARVLQLYHEAQAENPSELNKRNIESLRGRFKRLSQNANKWIVAYQEAAKRRSGMSKKDIEMEAHVIYEAGGSKFQDLVVFNDVMSKHPRWDLTSLHYQTPSRPENKVDGEEESGASTKKLRTSEDVEHDINSSSETPITGTSTIFRPIKRDKLRIKEKGKVTQSESEVAAELRTLRLLNDTKSQLIVAQLELERQKMQMECMNMEKKMLNTLLAKDHLSPVDEELKRRLITRLFGQT